jgi:hypothetical protein
LNPRNQRTRARRGVYVHLVAFSTLWLEIPDAFAYHVGTRTVWARDEQERMPRPSQFDIQERLSDRDQKSTSAKTAMPARHQPRT